MTHRRRPRRLHVPFPMGGDGREYLIWSYKWNAWHRRSDEGGACGYTTDLASAGVFEKAKARAYHDETVEKLNHRDNVALPTARFWNEIEHIIGQRKVAVQQAEEQRARFRGIEA